MSGDASRRDDCVFQVMFGIVNESMSFIQRTGVNVLTASHIFIYFKHELIEYCWLAYLLRVKKIPTVPVIGLCTF